MPRLYDRHFTYHSAIGSSTDRLTLAYAIGHLWAGKVVIDVFRIWQREGGRFNWTEIKGQVWTLSRAYHAESLLHDEGETEAIRLNLTDLDDRFVMNETPFTPAYRALIFEALKRRIIQQEILYPNDPRLLEDLRAMPDDPKETHDASTAAVANLAYYLYHMFIETRGGLPDPNDDDGITRMSDREWLSDKENDDDGRPKGNFGGGIIGGKLHEGGS